MWIAIALTILAIWLVGVLLFEVVSAVIHLLVIAAIVALVMHFVRKKRPPEPPVLKWRPP